MQRFWQKRLDSMDEQDAYDYIRRTMLNDDYEDSYRRGGRGGSSSGNSYHGDSQSKLKELAKVYDLISDFFEVQGLDPRSYLDMSNQRR